MGRRHPGLPRRHRPWAASGVVVGSDFGRHGEHPGASMSVAWMPIGGAVRGPYFRVQLLVQRLEPVPDLLPGLTEDLAPRARPRLGMVRTPRSLTSSARTVSGQKRPLSHTATDRPGVAREPGRPRLGAIVRPGLVHDALARCGHADHDRQRQLRGRVERRMQTRTRGRNRPEAQAPGTSSRPEAAQSDSARY